MYSIGVRSDAFIKAFEYNRQVHVYSRDSEAYVELEVHVKMCNDFEVQYERTDTLSRVRYALDSEHIPYVDDTEIITVKDADPLRVARVTANLNVYVRFYGYDDKFNCLIEYGKDFL